ncbi:MAG: hypothetical protein JJU37_08665 [Balneolaceae bacterium]|nr:hypothetical protein [Balneolaceae bacterium]
MKRKLSAPLTTLLATLFLFVPAVQAQLSVDVGGYLQSWYIANQSTEVVTTSQGMLPVLGTETIETQGFRLRRARILTRANINDTFSVTSWIELAGTSPSLLCFYADARIRPWFVVRVGQIMMPGQSWDTANNASSWLLFYDRAPITTTLSNVMGYSAFRDVGVMVHGRQGRFYYALQAGNGAGRFNQAGSNITQRKAGGGLYGARFDFEIVDGLTLGSHFATNQQRDVVLSGTGPFDIDRTSYSFRVATDNFAVDRLFSHFEYMSLTGKDDSRGLQLNQNEEYNLHGFYAQIGYRITREWHVIGRYDEMTEKPGQAGINVDYDRIFSNNYVFGISRYIFDGNREIMRAHLNYGFGQSGPMDLDNSILVLVFQLRFIP